MQRAKAKKVELHLFAVTVRSSKLGWGTLSSARHLLLGIQMPLPWETLLPRHMGAVWSVHHLLASAAIMAYLAPQGRTARQPNKPTFGLTAVEV